MVGEVVKVFCSGFIDYFDWYIFDSTVAFELISTESSLAFLEYFTDNSKT